MKIVLPDPHPGQQQVLDSDAKYKVLCCGRRWGKSLIAQAIAIQAIFSGERVAYVTPTNGLGKEFFREVMKLLKDVPEELLITNKTDLRIEIKTLGTLEFFSGETEALEKGMRGRKFHKVIVDEAAKINDLENAWVNIIMPTLIDFDGSALLVSTPRGKNYYFQLYLKGVHLEDNYESWNFPTHANPHLPPKALENLKASMPAASYRQEILAIPTENEQNPFSNEAITRNTIDKLSSNPTICLAIDLGRKVDPTVIIGMDEHGSMTYYESFQKSWPETIDTIKALPTSITKAIDATGLGDVVVGMLENEVSHLRPFIFTNKSKENIISELINDVEKDLIKFNKEVADEMHVFEQVETSAGNTRYEAQAGFHDDRVFALALCNHYRRKEWVSRTWKLYSL